MQRRENLIINYVTSYRSSWRTESLRNYIVFKILKIWWLFFPWRYLKHVLYLCHHNQLLRAVSSIGLKPLSVLFLVLSTFFWLLMVFNQDYPRTKISFVVSFIKDVERNQSNVIFNRNIWFLTYQLDIPVFLNELCKSDSKCSLASVDLNINPKL